jgi:hypothetical protein
MNEDIVFLVMVVLGILALIGLGEAIARRFEE